MRIVLISCVKGKKDKRMKARDLYNGPLFKNSLCVAKKQQPNKANIYILSAKYFLLNLKNFLGTRNYDQRTYLHLRGSLGEEVSLSHSYGQV